MSKDAGARTRTTFCLQVICTASRDISTAGLNNGSLAIADRHFHMLESQGKARHMATNITKVINHGFSKRWVCPSTVPDIVKAIFMVRVFSDPHTSRANT